MHGPKHWCLYHMTITETSAFFALPLIYLSILEAFQHNEKKWGRISLVQQHLLSSSHDKRKGGIFTQPKINFQTMFKNTLPKFFFKCEGGQSCFQTKMLRWLLYRLPRVIKLRKRPIGSWNPRDFSWKQATETCVPIRFRHWKLSFNKRGGFNSKNGGHIAIPKCYLHTIQYPPRLKEMSLFHEKK